MQHMFDEDAPKGLRRPSACGRVGEAVDRGKAEVARAHDQLTRTEQRADTSCRTVMGGILQRTGASVSPGASWWMN